MPKRARRGIGGHLVEEVENRDTVITRGDRPFIGMSEERSNGKKGSA